MSDKDKLFSELDKIREMQISLAKEHMGIEMLSSEGVSFEQFLREKQSEMAPSKVPGSGAEGLNFLHGSIPLPLGEEKAKKQAERVFKKHLQVKQLAQKLEQLAENIVNINGPQNFLDNDSQSNSSEHLEK